MKNQLTLLMWVSAVIVLIVGVSGAQEAKKSHVKIPVIAANPADVTSIEAIVKASYETISGGVGVPRQWGRDRTLYDPHVHFAAIEHDKKDAIQPHVSNEQEYADESDAMMVKDGFAERELGREIHQFGNVATVFSSYEGKATSTGKVVTRGVEILQLFNDGKRWWIFSIAWEDETPENPIPASLLPKS